MKILFCTNAFENVTNGPAKFANHLLKINSSYPDCEIKVLTEDISRSTEAVYKLELSYPKIFKFFSHFFRMLQYHKKALKIREEGYKWDVIVYNNAFIGLWSAIKLTNSVGMINDDNNATATFGFSYLEIRYTLFRILEKLSVRYHKLIITNSNYTKNTLVKNYPLLKDKCEILYKGIELYRQERTPSFETPLKILFVKKDYRRGGLLYLVQAVSRVSIPIELTVVGPSEEELASEFIDEIKKSTQNIVVKGPLSQQETFDIMLKSDIFCVPSLKEALGVANIEAISFGCAIIATKVGGIPEVMDYGNNGWMVDPANPDQIAEAIEDCYQNREARKRHRENGLKFIEKFDINNTLKNFVSIIDLNLKKDLKEK